MMKISTTPVVLALVAMAVTSCGTEEEPPPQASGGCAEVLGQAGVTWVERHVPKGDRDSLEWDGTGVKAARAQYSKQMKSWSPDAPHWESEVCEVSPSSKASRKMTLEFGPSSLSFDADLEKDGQGVLTPVNDDVRLHRVTRGENTYYGVYVKCKMPGTPARQATETPLAGVLTDTLTTGASAQDRMTHLLHATQVMARDLGCQNDPAVPAKPPAGHR